MWVPDDHTAGVGTGDPYPVAEVADNDLAVGRIVQTISHSRFWKSTAIFVLEDDPQNGIDHVDGHRSVLWTISPYSKPGVNDNSRDQRCADDDPRHHTDEPGGPLRRSDPAPHG